MQNFGKIKNAFNELISEGIAIKDVASKKIFKKYIKTITENELLKTQFLVVTNIENKIEADKDKATQFVKENIDLFSYLNKDKIQEVNKSLSVLCDKGDFLKEDFDYDKKDLHENISYLIFTKKTPNNIDLIIESTNKIVDYILNNKEKELIEAIDLPTSMVSTIMIDKYNEKYTDISESDKKILKILIDSTDEEKKEIYDKTLRECIDLINNNLKTANLVSKDKLLQVKDKLLNDTNKITETFSTNIAKLVDLRNNLISN